MYNKKFPVGKSSSRSSTVCIFGWLYVTSDWGTEPKILVINTYPQAGVMPKATFEKKLLFLNLKVISLRMFIRGLVLTLFNACDRLF